MFDKFNILIAGPVYDAVWVQKNVEYYMNQGFYVTVSTWDGWEADKLTIPHVKTSMNTVAGGKVMGYHPLDKKETPSNLYYQGKSVENALNAGMQKTDFVIKLRTDEFYSDLSPIVNKLLANPNKIVTNNVFLRDQKEFPYSISDHVIGMSYENMEKTFRGLCFFMDTYRNLISTTVFPKGNGSYNNKSTYINSEPAIAKMFLQSAGVITPLENDKASVIMQDYAEYVDVLEMGEYFITANHFNQYWSNIKGINKSMPKLPNTTKSKKALKWMKGINDKKSHLSVI